MSTLALDRPSTSTPDPDTPPDSRRLQVLALDPLNRVTGSCSLVFHPSSGTRLLVDCGTYQGERDAAERNADGFVFEPSALDRVLLTHGHLDHCGRLPQLVRDGFTGEVLATAETIEVAKVVLADSVKQQDDPELAAALHRIRWRPLGDALFRKPWVLAHDLFLFGLRSAHILGAVSFEIVAGPPDDRDAQTGVVFSGDVGSNVEDAETQPWLRHRMAPSRRRTLAVVESTYGDRPRDPQTLDPVARRTRLVHAVEAGLARGGAVVIPVFAVQRSQDLLLDLHLAMLEHPGFLDGVPLLYDAPMAARLHPVFRDAIAREHRSPSGKVRSMWLAKQLFADLGLDRKDPHQRAQALELLTGLMADVDDVPRWRPGERPLVRALTSPHRIRFDLPDGPWQRLVGRWQPVGWRRHRQAVVQAEEPRVVLATGGMCIGGPVVSWLRHHLPREDATILTTGYCSPSMPAGRMLEAARLPPEERVLSSERIRWGKEKSLGYAEVRATVAALSGWSGHADQRSLVEWVFAPRPWGEREAIAPHVLVQHGEAPARHGLMKAIRARARETGEAVRVWMPSDLDKAFDVLAEDWVPSGPLLGHDPGEAAAVTEAQALLEGLDPAMRRRLASMLRA